MKPTDYSTIGSSYKLCGILNSYGIPLMKLELALVDFENSELNFKFVDYVITF
jgi:hypothetical protein